MRLSSNRGNSSSFFMIMVCKVWPLINQIWQTYVRIDKNDKILSHVFSRDCPKSSQDICAFVDSQSECFGGAVQANPTHHTTIYLLDIYYCLVGLLWYCHCYVVELTDLYFAAPQSLVREVKAKALFNDGANAVERKNGCSALFWQYSKTRTLIIKSINANKQIYWSSSWSHHVF